MRPNHTKALLAAGKPALGTWLSMCNPLGTRMLAGAGWNWLTLDLEHTGTSWETAAHLCGLIADQDCIPLIRVPCNRHDHIKRALDIGAFGVVVPMVNSVEEAKQAVAACKYPPIGNRSVGGSQHAMHFKARPADYFQQADDGILVVLQCEHIDAVRNADAIFGVEGIDAIFVGPNDLAASMRGPDGSAPTAEAMAKAHADILAACQRQKVAPGFHAMNHHEAVKLLSDGWKFVAVASDLRFLGDGASEALKTVGLGTGEGMARY